MDTHQQVPARRCKRSDCDNVVTPSKRYRHGDRKHYCSERCRLLTSYDRKLANEALSYSLRTGRPTFDLPIKRHAPKLEQDGICDTCKISFEQVRSHQKYCSRKCTVDAYKERQKSMEEIEFPTFEGSRDDSIQGESRVIQCPHCQNRFTTYVDTKIYCSIRCQQNAARKRRYQKSEKRATAKAVRLPPRSYVPGR